MYLDYYDIFKVCMYIYEDIDDILDWLTYVYDSILEVYVLPIRDPSLGLFSIRLPREYSKFVCPYELHPSNLDQGVAPWLKWHRKCIYCRFIFLVGNAL